MPTDQPKVLIIFPMDLLEQITLAASIEGVSRSEWIREACANRIAAQDDEAAQPRRLTVRHAEPFEEPA